jgi:hypothetical protein
VNYKKSLLISSLALSLLTVPTVAFGQENTSNVKTEQTQTGVTKQNKLVDAFNTQKETKKLKEKGINLNNWKVTENTKDVVLDFDDGSKIIYSFEVTDTPTSTTNVLASSTKEFSAEAASTASVIYKTYHVSKHYIYGSADCTVSLYTDVKHEGRTVTVRTAYPGFKGTFASNDDQKTRVIDAVGIDPDYATTELSGQFTLGAPTVGNYYTRTYVIRMDIDPAGDAYLRVIQ